MRLLIFVLSYNAERHIASVLDDVPTQYKNTREAEILIIDDASKDRTVEVAREHVKQNGWTNVRVLKNRVNQGYGGNQKVGYRYAILQGFDVVVMLHGDNQYTPKALPELVAPFQNDPQLGCVLGVRFGQKYSPLSGGMPVYKYVGNRILTTLQNRLAGVALSEWHTGYRAYSTKALSKIAFELNTHDFHFDTEIILQLVHSNAKFMEVNIPTHYGDEICHVNGMRYAKDVVKASFKFWLQKHHLFFDVRYYPTAILSGAADDPAPAVDEEKDVAALIPSGARVLPIRASDLDRPAEMLKRLESGEKFDVVLMMDSVGRLSFPEKFLLDLSRIPYKEPPLFLFGTANVAFFMVRLMLIVGHFNYARNGVVDLTHKRLFSVHTLRNLMEQTGFVIQKEHFFPFPFQSLGFSAALAQALEKLNIALIRLAPKLFAYRAIFEAVPLAPPSATLVETLSSEHETAQRA